MNFQSLEPTDQYLIDAALKDPDAFGELVKRYQDRVYSFALRMTGNPDDALDLAQETMIRAYKALRSFNRDAPFAPWIYKIVANLSINFLKRQRTQRLVLAQVKIEEETRVQSVESLVEQRDTQRIVHAAIMSLPGQYRAAILLRHIYQLSYEEIASVLEIPVGTVKTRIFRGRRILLSKLEENGALDVYGLREGKATPTSLP